MEIVRTTQNASSDLVFRFRDFMKGRSRRCNKLGVLSAEGLSSFVVNRSKSRIGL